MARRRAALSHRAAWSAARKNAAPFAPLSPSRRSGLLKHLRTEEPHPGNITARMKATRPPRPLTPRRFFALTSTGCLQGSATREGCSPPGPRRTGPMGGGRPFRSSRRLGRRPPSGLALDAALRRRTTTFRPATRPQPAGTTTVAPRVATADPVPAGLPPCLRA